MVESVTGDWLVTAVVAKHASIHSDAADMSGEGFLIMQTGCFDER